MKKISILTLLTALTLGLFVGCGSGNQGGTQTPPQVSPVPPAVSVTPAPVLKPAEFVAKMLKTATDIGSQVSPLSKCSDLTSALGQLQTTIQGSKGTKITSDSQAGCDDSSHFGANASVDIQFNDFVEEGAPEGPAINGTYSVYYQISDGDIRTTINSSNFTYHGISYDFQDVYIDEEGVCSGKITINSITYKLTPACGLAHIVPLPNQSSI